MSKREQDYKRGYEHGMDDFTKTPVGEGGRHYWSGYHDGCVTRQTLKAREQAEKARAAEVEAANAQRTADYEKGYADGLSNTGTVYAYLMNSSYNSGYGAGTLEREAKEREPKKFLLLTPGEFPRPLIEVLANEIRVNDVGVLEFVLDGKVIRAYGHGQWDIVMQDIGEKVEAK